MGMKMMVMMFLSAATLMLGPAVAKPSPYVPLDNLKVIIDKIGNSTESSKKEVFVEELEILSYTCKDEFFCKSFEILKNQTQQKEVLMRNLKAYIVGKNVTCEETPKGKITQQEDISKLWSKILKCAKQVHMRPVTTPTPEAQPPVDQPSA